MESYIELIDLKIERKKTKELEQSSLLYKNIVESKNFEKKDMNSSLAKQKYCLLERVAHLVELSFMMKIQIYINIQKRHLIM